jgi:hypothetical protein
MVVQNTTAYTWDWYCPLVGDRASLLLAVIIWFGSLYNDYNKDFLNMPLFQISKYLANL